jgi:hypothetical protein
MVEGKTKALTYWIFDTVSTMPARVPGSQLQAKEVDWAGFVSVEDARNRLTPYMLPILEHVPPAAAVPLSSVAASLHGTLTAVFTPTVMATYSDWFAAHGFEGYRPVLPSSPVSTEKRTIFTVQWTNGVGTFTMRLVWDAPNWMLRGSYRDSNGSEHVQRRNVPVGRDALAAWLPTPEATEAVFPADWIFDSLYGHLPSATQR